MQYPFNNKTEKLWIFATFYNFKQKARQIYIVFTRSFAKINNFIVSAFVCGGYAGNDPLHSAPCPEVGSYRISSS